LTVLAAVFVVTLLAAVVTGSTFVVAVVVLDGVALGAYVAILVHLRRMASEREMKLHYLDPMAARPASAVPQRTYMSGRYAHPSNQQAVAR
jgi:MFS superfamily sulfate permease-like transporter